MLLLHLLIASSLLLSTLLIPMRLCAAPLPPLINFQSVLLDEGGNLLPSGSTIIHFQILDEQRQPIYVESQTIDIQKGSAVALIGNGSDGSGNPTGGIPEDIFESGAPRFLQVQVENQAVEEPMTIVPVPYAYWSQNCAAVANNSISFESFAPGVIGQLAESLGSAGIVSTQLLASTGGAGTVGVSAKFLNSGSSTVQGVLQDLDLSVKKRLEEINHEIISRSTADTFLNDKINSLTSAALDWSIPLTSVVNMGGNKIANLGTPNADSDASTKKYVDQAIESTVAKIDQAGASASANLAAAVAGNAKIATGTYIGNGGSTQSILTPNVRPRIVTLFAPGNGNFWTHGTDGTLNGTSIQGIWYNSSTGSVAVGSTGIQSMTSGNIVVSGQGNTSGVTYYYTIIGDAL